MMAGGVISVFNEKIAKNYDKWYESPRGRYYDGLEKNLIWKLLRPISGENLLDIGCGTGHHLKWFKPWGLNVTGVDNSPHMLEVARRNLGEEVGLELCDAKALPFAQDAFDIVVMITTLEFLDDPRLALKEAFRVCKDRVFLGVLNRYSWLSLKRRIKGLFFEDPIWRYARFFSCRELMRRIKGLDKNLKVDWETCIPHPSGRNPFGVFIGILIKKPGREE